MCCTSMSQSLCHGVQAVACQSQALLWHHILETLIVSPVIRHVLMQMSWNLASTIEAPTYVLGPEQFQDLSKACLGTTNETAKFCNM